MRKVNVKYVWHDEVCSEFTDKGVFSEIHNLVLRVDKFGEVAIHLARPVEGTDDVIVSKGAKDLLSDNPDLFIDLVMSM